MTRKDDYKKLDNQKKNTCHVMVWQNKETFQNTLKLLELKWNLLQE